MSVYRISDDFYDHSYTLIALHCALEDYRIAYFLNVHLHVKFKRLADMVFYQHKNAFSLYEWEDRDKGTLWNLISNTSRTGNPEAVYDNSLFNSGISGKISYLIPERKQADYFIKIEDESLPEETMHIVHTINRIPHIVTAYSVDPRQLKSKQNLII